jgi:hypothetical protein
MQLTWSCYIREAGKQEKEERRERERVQGEGGMRLQLQIAFQEGRRQK